MRAKPGRILSPRMAATIHSPSTPSATSRKQSGWIMKGAIRRSADDMIEMLESGDRKATTFLIGEIERLFDWQSLDCGKKSGWAVCHRTDRSGTFYAICVVVSVYGKAGKIITTPKYVRVIHSASTLSIGSRSHYRYMLKLAIRRAVDDMIEILSSGDRKATTFLPAELERLLDYHSWPDAERVRQVGDGQGSRSGGAPLVWQGGGQ